MSIPQTPSPLSNILASKTYNAAWFSGSTKEAQITAAIAAAVLDGASYVYLPASMLPYNASTVTFNSTIKMLREGGDMSVHDVKAYGAWGDGVTDDRVAIQAAINAAVTAGSGSIYFPATSGKYFLPTIGGTVSLPIPVSGPNFTTIPQIQQYHFYLLNPTGIKFIGDGITIKSTVTNGGIAFIFDGAQDMEFRGITFESISTFDASGNPIVSGMNMIGFTSTVRDADRIVLHNIKALNSYVGFYCFGDAASAFRVRNVTLNNFVANGGEYGIATHNNGDNITFNSVRIFAESARAYFAYGVDNHQGMIYASGTANNLFGQFLIKAYDRDCTNIKLKIRTDNNSNGGVYKLYIQSQHHVATQPTPKAVKNIDIDYSDLGTTGSGIALQYLQDAVSTGTVSTTVFDNIRIAGHVTGGVDVLSVQTPRGFADFTGLVPVSGSIWSTTMNNKGFYSTRFTNYTPVLTFGGSAVGIAYTTQVGEYYIDRNFVYVTVELLLSSKGAQVGAAAVSIPATPATYSANLPTIVGVGFSGMAAMTGPIMGLIFSNQANLYQQGAAAVAALSDVNFTNTSRIMLTLQYPI